MPSGDWYSMPLVRRLSLILPRRNAFLPRSFRISPMSRRPSSSPGWQRLMTSSRIVKNPSMQVMYSCSPSRGRVIHSSKFIVLN